MKISFESWEQILNVFRRTKASNYVIVWNKDPAHGVIGVQTGPPSAMGLQQPPVSSEAFYLDACCGDNSEDTAAFPCAGQVDQGDLPRSQAKAEKTNNPRPQAPALNGELRAYAR
jgi:hypothetical protein